MSVAKTIYKGSRSGVAGVAFAIPLLFSSYATPYHFIGIHSSHTPPQGSPSNELFGAPWTMTLYYVCVFVYCQFLLWMILLLHFVQRDVTLFQDSWSLPPYHFPKPSAAPEINSFIKSSFHSKCWIKLKQPSEQISVTPERHPSSRYT